MTRRHGHARLPLIVVAVLGVVSPADAAGQTTASFSVGAAEYDLAGTGLTGTGAVRIERRVAAALSVQVGTGLFWYETQGDQRVAMLLPEVGVLAHLPSGFPLYLAVGAGHTLGVAGSPDDDPTLFAALGVDLGDPGGWGVRPELRVRTVDPWIGTIADFAISVRRRIGE